MFALSQHPARGTCARLRLPAITAGLLCHLGVSGSPYLAEGFNYAPGILGANSPWTHPTNQIMVVNGNLGYPGLAGFSPAGNSVSVAQGNTAFTLRPFDSTATSGTVYCSFLIKYTSVSANVFIAGLLPGAVPGPLDKTTDPCDLVVVSATGGYKLGIRAKGQSASYAAAVLALDTPHLVVLKHTLSTGASFLFVNPVPGASEPDSPGATSSGTAGADLAKLFFRSGSSTAGNFLVDNVRVASTWPEVTPPTPVTPASKLAFSTQPAGATMARPLAPVTVQLRSADDVDIASNNVPVTMALSAGSFAQGATTANTDASGKVTFTGLVVASPGDYTLTASASGIGDGLASGTSDPFEVGITNTIDANGLALAAFLDSLQVERYWANGVSVNWLTGAAGGSGPNMTQGTASHCSAFAPAVAYLRGVYLLRQPDASDLNLANRQADWLRTNTASGWFAVASPVTAQHMVNTGALVVASCKEDSGSGHIAVLRPSIRSDADVLTLGPQECQSGINNYNDTNVVAGFGQHPGAFPGRILFYAHAATNDVPPVNPVLGPSTATGGLFRFNATSIIGRPYKLQLSADLRTWTDLRSFTNSNADTNFFCTSLLTDSVAATPRFYRLRTP